MKIEEVERINQVLNKQDDFRLFIIDRFIEKLKRLDDEEALLDDAIGDWEISSNNAVTLSEGMFGYDDNAKFFYDYFDEIKALFQERSLGDVFDYDGVLKVIEVCYIAVARDFVDRLKKNIEEDDCVQNWKQAF